MESGAAGDRLVLIKDMSITYQFGGLHDHGGVVVFVVGS